MRGFGAARLCLLVSFILLSGTLYFYVDSHTLQRWLKQIQGNPYGYLHSFLIAYTLSVIFLFPCMIVQVISGALYGFWIGLLISWVATSVGQSLAFLIGRYLFRPTVKSYLHNTWPSFPAIDAAIKKEGWRLVCLLRLSPVLPYNVLNYALAITPVSFWVFSIASAVATVPWTALYVYLGTFSTDLVELSRGKISTGDDSMHMVRQVLSGVFIVITAVYGYMVSHKAIVGLLKDVPEMSPGVNGHSHANGTSNGGSIHLSSLTNGVAGNGKHASPPGTLSAQYERVRDMEDGRT